MLYVDKLLSTPFRVLARMVDTLACRRVEMLLAETLQVPVYCMFIFLCDKQEFGGKLIFFFLPTALL